MVVQNQMASGWSVLPGPSGERCGMGPDCLDALSVGHPNAIHVSEIVACLARRSVTNDMELGNSDTE